MNAHLLTSCSSLWPCDINARIALAHIFNDSLRPVCSGEFKRCKTVCSTFPICVADHVQVVKGSG